MHGTPSLKELTPTKLTLKRVLEAMLRDEERRYSKDSRKETRADKITKTQNMNEIDHKLRQGTKMTSTNTHFSIITLNMSDLKWLIKEYRVVECTMKPSSSFFGLQETHLNFKDRHKLAVKG